MSTNIGLNDGQRDGATRILAGVLGDLHVLYVKTRNYHWNVTGPHFNDLHKWFGEQHDQLAAAIDEVAERIRALGRRSPGSMAEFLQAARLTEQSPQQTPDARGMVAALLADHESAVRQLRADAERCNELGDAGTNDFLIGLMQDHEKTAWMLRAMGDR
jgi:starvation-inducible DNA-binding protein